MDSLTRSGPPRSADAPAPPAPPRRSPTSGSLGARPPLPVRDRAGRPSSPPGAAAEGTGGKGAADLTTLSPGRGRDGGTGIQTGVQPGRRARGCGRGCAAATGPPAPRGQNTRPGAPGPRPSPAADPAAEQALRSPGRTRRSRRFQNLPRRRPARSAPPPPAAPPPAAAGPARLSRRHVPTSRPRAARLLAPRRQSLGQGSPLPATPRAGSGRRGARERGAGPEPGGSPGPGGSPPRVRRARRASPSSHLWDSARPPSQPPAAAEGPPT